MPHRKFTDSFGRIWDVWSVMPEQRERRISGTFVRDDVVERRVGIGKLPLPARLSDGWLAFECVHERRRLAPIPSDWTTAPDDLLCQWCDAASAATSPRRVL